jgi:hypothetical protein
MGKTIGIYFKDHHDADQIRASLKELAQVAGVGTGPDDLMAAIADGRLRIVPSSTTDAGQYRDLPLASLLLAGASTADPQDPHLAAALRDAAALVRRLM